MTLPRGFLKTPLAHRGLHDRTKGRIENSTSAFLAAIEHGYGIELDVQISSDGQAMVFHDYALERLTGKNGVISDFSAAELSEITLLDGNDTIPTLAEILRLIDNRTPLLIEIKDQDGQLGPNTGALERATALALQGYDGDVAVMSFNPHAIRAFSAHSARTPVGLVTCDFNAEWTRLPTEYRQHLTEIADISSLNGCFISHDHTDLAAPAVARIKEAGLAVLCWTVKSPEQEETARKLADNVTFEGYLA